MKPLRLIVIILAGLALTPAAKGSVQQDSIVFRGDVEREFVEAMRSFTSQKFDSAAVLFSNLLHQYPRSHRTTGTYIMGAKAYYRIGNYR
jgi:outer membrane protein assembly factor BamD (BamD/ComL family)